ncbi:YggT family protein [Streptococcus merionis]|uniref:YggT family protein n=1 Tax=Streptococcus merionis TaxID=400065 RepID=UPI003515F1A2
MIQLFQFIATVFTRVIEVYSFILLAYALLSWFPGAYHTRLGDILGRLAEPYISIFRRFNLTFGMMDFSVAVAILSLQLIQMLGLRLLDFLMVLFFR